MAAARAHRYKGTSPFLDSDLDRKTFFGRDLEIRALSSLVLAERLSVLFAKSGMGKTSLINAGVVEPLREKGYFPMVLRVGDPGVDTVQAILDGVRDAAAAAGVECERAEATELWEFFKRARFWSSSLDLLTPVLVLDQFEELFTLKPRDDQRELARQLAELVRGRAAAPEGDGPEALDSSPPDVKILLSLREDFLAHLEDLTEEIPGILHNRLRLGPLTREGARQAIVGPARLEDEALETTPFTYREEALAEILSFLGKQRRGEETVEVDEVEPVQLQLICLYLEELVQARQAKGAAAVEVTDRDLGGERRMQRVLESFYDRTIASIRPRSAGRAARRLCEKRLISAGGRRLTEDGEEIERRFKLSKERLDRLVDARLLRSEPRLGGTFYELSHDTLIEPITESRKRRRRKRWIWLGGVGGTFLLLLFLPLLAYWLFGPEDRQRTLPGSVLDEAKATGVEVFAFAREDYFREMDGGEPLGPDEVRGRNTWMVWTGGNDRFWDLAARRTHGAVDLLKTISSHPGLGFGRENRFENFGLINEPCFSAATGPNPHRYGLWLDVRDPECPPEPFEDPKYSPLVGPGARGDSSRLSTGSSYGYASGVVGLRLFPNPDFDEAAARRWDPERYYFDPAYSTDSSLVRPYRVGVACALCHVGPDPVRPPSDPESPGWENLSSTVGAQHLRFHRVFYPDKDESSFLWQILHSYPAGALDTSLVATDGILNPRAIQPLHGLPWRLEAAKSWGREILAGGGADTEPFCPDVVRTDFGASLIPRCEYFDPPDVVWTPHYLADGAGSTGPLGTLGQMFLHFGLFSEEWLLHFNPLVGGQVETPMRIKIAEANSTYWNATVRQLPNLMRFLLRASARPPRLAAAPGGRALIESDDRVLRRGRVAFAEHCAACHSSKLPAEPEGADLSSWLDYRDWTLSDDFKRRMKRLVLADDFLKGNYLSNDRRVPISEVGSNACASLSSGALEGRVWDNFSSLSYKELPAAGKIAVHHPVTGEIREVDPPGGGRGYLRVPSLLGLWSTAPFLHNNSVPRFTELPDPSVEGRMALFERAIDQLLNPENRERDDRFPGYLARTTSASYLSIGGDALPAMLQPLTAFRNRVYPGIFGPGEIQIGPIPAKMPIGLIANVTLQSDAGDLASRFSARKTLLVTALRLKRLHKSLDPSATDDEVAKALSDLVDPLLELSACPDFVVNRGHEYGADLPDGDKRALIEFLKTL